MTSASSSFIWRVLVRQWHKVSWLNLVLFSASDRGNSGSYRYLAPAAWSFPFLIGAVYISSGKWMATGGRKYGGRSRSL